MEFTKTNLVSQIKTNRFLIFSLIFYPAFYAIQNFNHRFMMHDFEVYYTAALKAVEHQGFYNQSFGLSSGIFKYSPASALLFIPFTLFSFPIAASIYFGIISCLVYLCFQKSYELLKIFFQELHYDITAFHRDSILFVGFLVLISAIHRELHLGNVNILLLFLCLCHIECCLHKKNLSAGILFAIILLIKPHFLILIPALFISGKFSIIIQGMISLALFMILPVFYFGPTEYLNLCNEWIQTMLAHNSDNNLINASNTLQFWFFKIIPDTIPFITSIVTSLIITTIGIILFIVRKQGTGKEIQSSFYALSAIAYIGLIPNITVTDTEHFLLALPLIVLLSMTLRERAWNLFHYLVITSFILHGFNWFDIWGRQISSMITNSGALGIANTGIILLSLWKINQIHKFQGHTKESYETNLKLTN